VPICNRCTLVDLTPKYPTLVASYPGCSNISIWRAVPVGTRHTPASAVAKAAVREATQTCWERMHVGPCYFTVILSLSSLFFPNTAR
jgi:hypothetical protein